MPNLRLPTDDGCLEPYRTQPSRAWRRQDGSFDRLALSAVHVVSDPPANYDPWMTSPAASSALSAHRRRDIAEYHATLAPTLPLARHIFRLADAAGLLNDPDDAAARVKAVLRVHGIDG